MCFPFTFFVLPHLAFLPPLLTVLSTVAAKNSLSEKFILAATHPPVDVSAYLNRNRLKFHWFNSPKSVAIFLSFAGHQSWGKPLSSLGEATVSDSAGFCREAIPDFAEVRRRRGDFSSAREVFDLSEK